MEVEGADLFLQTNTVTVTQPCFHLSVETMSPSKPNTLDYWILMPRQCQVKGAQRSLQQERSLSWGPRPVIRQSPWCPVPPAALPALGEGRVLNREILMARDKGNLGGKGRQPAETHLESRKPRALLPTTYLPP